MYKTCLRKLNTCNKIDLYKYSVVFDFCDAKVHNFFILKGSIFKNSKKLKQRRKRISGASKLQYPQVNVQEVDVRWVMS